MALIVPETALPIFDAALAPFIDALSWSAVAPQAEPGAGGALLIVAHAARPPARAAIVAATALAAMLAGIDAPAPTFELLPDTDWLAASLRSFPPIAAGRFHLRGAHIDAPPPAGKVALLIDAGAAFGSGEHASTRGCLLALDALLKRRRFARALDLGCGSGVLALALAKASPARALAVDIDAAAVDVAASNARRNGVAARVRAAVGDGYRSRVVRRSAPYDLVLANILARPLARMASPLAAHLAPRGLAVLAGLLVRQERSVLAAHRAQGLALLARLRIDGWSTLVVGRR